MQTDAWIYSIVVALSVIIVASVIDTVIMTIIGQPIPEILIALVSVAASGLARLLIPSPLNIRLFE
jgi:hypothetical protein